jgi:hypothetical protein
MRRTKRWSQYVWGGLLALICVICGAAGYRHYQLTKQVNRLIHIVEEKRGWTEQLAQSQPENVVVRALGVLIHKGNTDFRKSIFDAFAVHGGIKAGLKELGKGKPYVADLYRYSVPLDSVLQAVEDEDPLVRVLGLQALSWQFEDEHLVKVVEKHLADPDPAAQREAVTTLGNMCNRLQILPSQKGKAKLIELAEEKGEHILRASALGALAQIGALGDSQAKETLIAVSRNDPEADMRGTAARGLYEIKRQYDLKKQLEQ